MEKIKNKLNYFIDNYLIFVIFATSLLTLLPYTKILSSLSSASTGGLVYRGIILCIISVIFLIALFLNKEKPKKPLIVGCAIYIIFNTISIFATPVIRNIENLPTIKYILGFATIFANILTIFVALYFLKKHDIKQEKFEILVFILIGMGVALCLYTYIFQYREIANMFVKDDGWNYDVTSIFQTKTTYGFCLLIISVFSVIYILNTKKYWMYVFPSFFFANSILIASKKSILCIGILLISVLIYHLLRNLKNNEKKWGAIFGVSLFVITLLLLFIFVPQMRFGIFNDFYNFISKVIIQDGITVMQDRIQKVSSIINATKYPFGIIFGTGEGIGSYVLSQSGAYIGGDCIYATIYSTGGIIKLILYLLFVSYIVYKIIKMEKSKDYKFFRILFISIILICGLFEDDSVVGINFSFLFTCIILYGNSLKID